jgi:methionyl-tRNA formyltransferase
MRIDAGLDTGEMLMKAETGIGEDENAVELSARLAGMGAALLVKTLDGLARGAIVAEKQDPALATHAPLLKKEDGLIDWGMEARMVHNRVRGFQPWPGAYTSFRGQILHVWRTRMCDAHGVGGAPGHFAALKPPAVECGRGAVELLEVQIEGRKRVSGTDFANGQRLSGNDILGEPRH